jgi:hypothetical protein
MATRAEQQKELYEALAAADAAGDTEAAQAFADALRVLEERDYSQPPGPEAPLNDPAANWASGVGDVARVGVDSFSLGGADYMAGGDARAQTDAARERLGPFGAFATEMAGGGLTPMFSIPQKFGRAVGTVGHALQGGAQSVADAYMHGDTDPMSLLKAAGTGTGATGALSAIADPVATWWSKRKARQGARSTDDVFASANQKYADVSASGGVYKNRDLRSLAAEIQNMKLTPGLDDRAIALRKRLLKDWRNKDITPEQFDDIRQWVRKKMKTVDPHVASTGEDFVKNMDKFESTADVFDAAGNPIPGVGATQKEARAEYSRGKRAETVEKAAAVPLKSQGGYFNPYGGDVEEATRDKFGKLYEEATVKGGKGYSPAEIDKVKEMAMGTTMRNLGALGRAMNPFKKGPEQMLKIAGSAATLGLAPTIARVVQAAGEASTRNAAADLGHLIKDPTGKGIQADPETIAKLKLMLAKTASAGARKMNRGMQ